jgi:hypothetical protein
MVYSILVSRLFKLVGKTAVSVPLDEYLQWIISDPKHGHRTVQVDEFLSGSDSIRVSTAFLMGINHRYINSPEPLLFETMVFGGTMDQSQWRYPTWEQAEAGHQKVLEQLLREMPYLTKVVEEPKGICSTRYERIIRNLDQA